MPLLCTERVRTKSMAIPAPIISQVAMIKTNSAGLSCDFFNRRFIAFVFAIAKSDDSPTTKNVLAEGHDSQKKVISSKGRHILQRR